MVYFNAIMLFGLLILNACVTGPASRDLSVEEMHKYNLIGVINDAKICPTVFDNKIKQHQIKGKCEIVNCLIENGATRCTATPDNHATTELNR